jgi:membrane protein implicated in regulation of membrane protease activity
MEWQDWQLWLLLGLAMWILEILVSGMIAGCLGTGALMGAVGAGLGAGFEGQILITALSSLAAYFFLRPLALKHWFGGAGVATNVHALVGQSARVSQDFDPETGYGRCRVDGDDWRAHWSPSGPGVAPPRLNDPVRILRVESATLMVTDLD